MMRYLAGLLLVVGPIACTEVPTAPGACPTFCPNGSIESTDTILTDVIVRDSSYRGYVQPYQAEAMTATDIPGVIDSRAFFVTNKMFRTVVSGLPGDTVQRPISIDSVRLRLTIMRRDTGATNLRLRVYSLPVTSDSNSTFQTLDPYFTSAPIDSFNISAILAKAPITDTVTKRMWGDSIWTDSAGHTITVADSGRILHLYWRFDTLQVPLVDADSNEVGMGIRVAADSLASVSITALGSTTTDHPQLTWYYQFTVRDTASGKDSVHIGAQTLAPQFNSFVFNPPLPPLDSNLVVGGVPSARSLLRVALPAYLKDSVDIVRATLILVPVEAVRGAPADSFQIRSVGVLADVGAKSPNTGVTTGKVTIHMNAPDTVRMELTDLVRNWVTDTTQTRAFMLGQVPEAASYTQMRFYSSRTPAFRPGLHITYVKRYPFGRQ
ncbi:MAG TPA: hypothetical protein VG454_08740 [Gemmatimonadales bacterium]|nr:hypothetical protein [Gemmatimonadales bacterium]